MKRIWLLALLTIALARGAETQQSRDLLRLGIEAYDFAAYETALPLLVAGLNPAGGPRDTLWVAGLHRLAHILLERDQDSLAAVWVRWALRQKPDLAVDTLNFPPAVANVFALAQQVAAGGSEDTVTETLWEWPAAPPGQQATGAIRVERAGTPVSAFIEKIGALVPGEERALASGSYRVLVSAPGSARVWLQREVLPGITTVVRLRLRTPAGAERGSLYVTSAPWGSVYLDHQFAGYTPLAAHPTAVGIHHLRVERLGSGAIDTTIAVEQDQPLRLAFGGQVAAPEQVRLAAANWSLGLLDSAEIHFRAAVREDAFLRLDPEVFNPEVVMAFQAARAASVAVGIRVPSDTVLPLQTGRWPVAVAVTQPGRVHLSLTRSDAAGAAPYELDVALDSSATVWIPAMAPATAAPGVYRLVAEYAAAGGRSASAAASLEAAEHTPDTVAHEAAPADSLFRLELRWGPRRRSALLRGLGVGAGAAAIPLLLGKSQLRTWNGESRALGAGAVVSLTGLASYFLARPRQLLPENMAYNRALRAAWEQRNRAIVATNEARRNTRMLRIRAVPGL